VFIPPLALAGTGDDTTAITLEIIRYGDPGKKEVVHQGKTKRSASAVYDFKFGDDGVSVKPNRKITLTLSFALPDGMEQREFLDTLVVGYYNESQQAWVFNSDVNSGIENIRVNWNSHTVMFEVTHLSKFAVFTLVDFEVKSFDMEATYGLISYPMNVAAITASELMAQVPNCSNVWKWDAVPGQQRWVSRWAEDFTVSAGHAYLAAVSGQSFVSFRGDQWASPTFDLQIGYNLLALPQSLADTVTTGEELANHITAAGATCNNVWKWDNAAQRWVSFWANSFTLEAGAAYLVSVTSVSQWP